MTHIVNLSGESVFNIFDASQKHDTRIKQKLEEQGPEAADHWDWYPEFEEEEFKEINFHVEEISDLVIILLNFKV